MMHWLPLKIVSTFLHSYFRAFQTEFVSFWDNFVSFPHAVSGPNDCLQSYSTAQNVETLQNDHSNVPVDNRACFCTVFFLTESYVHNNILEFGTPFSEHALYARDFTMYED